jgi:hypothetical protein
MECLHCHHIRQEFLCVPCAVRKVGSRQLRLNENNLALKELEIQRTQTLGGLALKEKKAIQLLNTRKAKRRIEQATQNKLVQIVAVMKAIQCFMRENGNSPHPNIHHSKTADAYLAIETKSSQ